VSSGNRQVGNHFSERDHDRVTDGTHEGVTEEETEGTTVGEGVPGTYEVSLLPLRRGFGSGRRVSGDIPRKRPVPMTPPIEIMAICGSVGRLERSWKNSHDEI
jgi:hypothetical protein